MCAVMMNTPFNYLFILFDTLSSETENPLRRFLCELLCFEEVVERFDSIRFDTGTDCKLWESIDDTGIILLLLFRVDFINDKGTLAS